MTFESVFLYKNNFDFEFSKYFFKMNLPFLF
nr:MAG TPA: hypothetical protein [Bacteriophage sp.]DAK47128.1 MAG TPA: hypothetical protein [Caudoviricetes sp.]